MYNHLCLVLCLYGWIYMVGLTVGVYGGVLWWDFKLSFSTKYFDISSQSAHTDSLKLSSGWNALVIEKILLNRQCGEKKLVIPTRRFYWRWSYLYFHHQNSVTSRRHVESSEEPGDVRVTGLPGQTPGPHHAGRVHLQQQEIMLCCPRILTRPQYWCILYSFPRNPYLSPKGLPY